MELETITVQEVRKDPLAFLKLINAGKTLTVIYHSRPYATVTSANSNIEEVKPNLLESANQARLSATKSIDSDADYKEIYNQDMSDKYGLS